MSSLFSSFVIEPVVRQARRISGAPSSTASAHANPGHRQSLSHANRDAQAAVIDASRDDAATSTSHGSLPDHETANAATHDYFFRRFIVSPFTADPPSERGEAATSSDRPQLVESPVSELPPVAPEAAPEDDMSQNPSYGIPERFRSTEIASSMSSGRASIGGAGGRSHRNTGRHSRRSTGDDYNPGLMAGSLPEDDGMRSLRDKIHEVWRTQVTNEEKARMMHDLMTERYAVSQPHMFLARSPSSTLSQDRSFAAGSPASMLDLDVQPKSPDSMALCHDPNETYNMTAEEAQLSYRPKLEASQEVTADEGDGEDPGKEEFSLGCIHYKRNVKIQCFDCRQWYPCRHCHDEQQSHRLNRRKTRSMYCMLCSTPQPAAEYCNKCGERTAWYYCDICKLWDDDSTKRIYHCDDCGICRRGEGLGKDYVHCKRCNVCISIQFAETHRCIERATECDCPICGDYMFTSSISVVAMPCGHYLHKGCYIQYMQTAYKCPICKKSAVNMELQWRKLDQAIESQPMPAQFADTKAVIHCNDCSARSSVKYHWLGNKCAMCDSYNTNEIQLLGGSDIEQHAGDPARTGLSRRSSAQQQVASRRPGPEYRSSRSYFLDVEEQVAGHARPTSAVALATDESLSRYEVLRRISRSLSPRRNYLGTREEEMMDASSTHGEAGRFDHFWGEDGRFLSGEEEEDDDDDDEDEEEDDDEGDSDESMPDDDDEEDEVEEVDALEGIELFGHR